MYASYETCPVTFAKRLTGETFATLGEAVIFHTYAGGFAEIDADHDAADVFTRGGVVLGIERAANA
jgi:hypothetical protein